jgi:hypothetical protein
MVHERANEDCTLKNTLPIIQRGSALQRGCAQGHFGEAFIHRLPPSQLVLSLRDLTQRAQDRRSRSKAFVLHPPDPADASMLPQSDAVREIH